jgi:FkbM family methyltransferase
VTFFYFCFDLAKKIKMKLILVLYHAFILIKAWDVQLVKYNNISFYTGPNSGLLFNSETKTMEALFKTAIFKSNSNQKCTVVDVGMNDGFYTMMAAKLGCTVYSFEIQFLCLKISENCINKNNISNLVTIIPQPVSYLDGEELSIPYGEDQCDDNYGFTRQNCPQCNIHNLKTYKKYKAVSLQHFFNYNTRKAFQNVETIDFLKISVEGHEPLVLLGSLDLFKYQRILIAVVEIITIKWNKPPVNTSMTSYNSVFMSILSYGYEMFCLLVGDENDDKIKLVSTSNVHLLHFLHTNKCVNYLIKHKNTKFLDDF